MKNNALLFIRLTTGLCAVLMVLITYRSSSQNISLNTPTEKSAKQPTKIFTTEKINGVDADLFGTQKRFVENIGQYGENMPKFAQMGKILYGYEGLLMPVLFTEKGIIYLQQKVEGPSEEEREKMERKGLTEKNGVEEKVTRINRAVSMEWLGANPTPKITVEDKTQGYLTFGSLNGKAWAYKRIIYKDLYPGIDVIYSFNQNSKAGFEYSLSVKPGADVSVVKMHYGGDVKRVKKDKNGNILITSDIDGITESVPFSFYGDTLANILDDSKKVGSAFKLKGNDAGFELSRGYDKSRAVTLDPFVTSTGNLTGINSGIAKDIDFDYNGNIYVTGGGDGTTHKMAKYDASGALQWTFSGTLVNPAWSFGTYYGGWVVDKSNGSVYLGQGFEYTHGFSIIRLTTAGLYDNYISTPNASFREDWKMFWNCNNGSPQILIAGGGTNSNINFGICSPPSTTISSLNITGIPYTGIDGWAQDVSDIVIDPVTNDMYTIYGSLYGTPSLSNKIYKNKPPYSSGSVAWSTYSGFVSVQEIANRPYLLTLEIDNSSNILAVNSSYFFYWDGKNLKAFDKATGGTAGTPLTIAANTTLMYGGIIADECNNVFVGSSNGTIKVFKFNGAVFDDAAAPDISIPGYSTNSVYDLAYNEAQKLLYVSGNGFVASFDISSYGCPATSYTINVLSDCVAASATVTISPAPPVGSTVTYVLYNGSTQIASNSTGVFTGLSPGITYTVKVYVNQVCSGIQTVKDFTLPGPVLALVSTDATCGNSTGTIIATGSGGTGSYTYSKDGINFQTSGNFIGLSAGLYVITVVDAGVCKTSDTVIVNNKNGPTLTVSKTDALCGNSNGTITITGNGGAIPYQYSINGTIFQSSNIFNGVTSGVYTVTIKDANGCTNVATVNILSSSGPQLTATPASTTCNNSNGSITAYGTGGASPLQYSINGNIFQISNIFSNLSAGTYTVTVKDAFGCFQSIAVIVANIPGPTVTAVATAASCNNINGSITATGSGGVSPLQYSINGVFFQTNNIFTGLAAGAYTVTVKDANGCTNTTIVSVNNSSGPTITATSTNASCGLNNGLITVTATGTGPLQYSKDGFNFQGSNTFSLIAAGTYVIYVKDALGCIATTTITVKNTAAPQIAAIATPASCTINDGTITITATGGTGTLQYSIDGTAFQISNVFAGLSTGNYIVTVKDVNGCTSTVGIFVDNADGLKLIASSVSTYCSSSNGSITATAEAGAPPLQYSINGTTFQSNNIFTALSSGNYTVTVKDVNGCIANVAVTVNASSGVAITAVAGNSCNNTNGTITITGIGGALPWTYSINGTTFQANNFFYGLIPGTYTVTVKDANGCTNTTTATISNVSGSGPTITVKFHDAHSCNGDLGRIDNISATGGTAPYLFSLNGGPFISTNQFLNLVAGSYTVTVKDANGCTKTVQGVIIDLPAPTVTAISTSTPCGSITGTIQATGHGGQNPYKYSLNGGPFQSNGLFTGLSAGTYTIRVLDDEGCTGSIQVTVLNTGGPTVSTIKTDASCGLNNGTITAAGIGSGPLKYNINGGAYQSSGLFTGLASGIYTVTVQDATLCTGGATVTIINPGGPLLSITNTPAACNTSNGSITATVTGGTPPLKYSIDGTIFQFSNIFNNLAPATFTITVLDGAGCFSKANTTVANTPIPEVSAFTTASLCSGNSGSISANGTKGTPPYLFSIDGKVFQSSNIFSNLPAGFYTITIKDATGCTNSTGVTVSSLSGPQLSLSATSATCGNLNGLITGTATGGTAPFSYSDDGINYWSGNTFVVGQGTYIISAKDANGCINSKAILVGNIDGPQQLSAIVSNSACGKNNGIITATAAGGTAPLQYSLDGSTYQPGSIFNSLSPNTYTLSVKDANGCIKTVPIILINLPGPTITATTSPTSCGLNDGSINVILTGGTGVISYSKDGIIFQSSNVFSGLAAGPYTITAKDAMGCTTQTTISVLTIGTLVTPTFNPVAAICSGAVLAPLPITSLNGISGTWLPALNNTATTTYTFSPDAGQCAVMASLTITVNPLVTPAFNPVAAICSGAVLAPLPLTSLNGINGSWLPALNNTATTTYTFTPDPGQCAVTAALTITVNQLVTPAFNPVAAICSGAVLAPLPITSLNGISGTWLPALNNTATTTYTFTPDPGQCAVTAALTVTVNTLPLLPTVTVTDATCNISNGTIIITSSTTGLLFSFDGGAFSIYPPGGYKALASSVHTLVAKNTGSCISAVSNITINNSAGPELDASSNATSCSFNNGSITASATGGVPPLQYSINGLNYQPGNLFSGLAAGSYTIQVKDANACTSSTNVTVATITTIAVNAGNDITLCEGTSKELNATVTNGINFSWSPEAGLSNASILNPLARPLTTVIYVLTASSGLCIQRDSVTVFVNPAPKPDAGKDTSICFGTNIRLQGINGASYLWNPPLYLSNQNIANPIVNKPQASITYYLSVTDDNGCKSLINGIIHIEVKPTIGVNAGTDTAISINQPLQLNATDITNTGFSSYSWSPSAGLSDPFIQNPVALLDKDIIYTVTAHTADGCQASDNITVRVFRDADIYVPTAFTPNGDGLNDFAKAIPVGIKTFKYFTIFNRFGEMVFTTANPNAGWNGVYNGQRQGSGTFVWKTEGIDYNGKIIFKKGTVVLIR